MKRISLFFEEKVLALLKRVSDNTGVPIAELIRRAVNNYLQRRKL